jgi:hypothetical protein
MTLAPGRRMGVWSLHLPFSFPLPFLQLSVIHHYMSLLFLSLFNAVEHLYSYNNVQTVYNANTVNGIVMSVI